MLDEEEGKKEEMQERGRGHFLSLSFAVNFLEKLQGRNEILSKTGDAILADIKFRFFLRSK